MGIKYNIWYIFCYSERDFQASLSRLKNSINHIPKELNIKILTWHKDLKNKLNSNYREKKIEIFSTAKRTFSRSFFINQIAFKYEKNSYFYLSDIDLIFHFEYFNWLNYIAEELNYKKNDLRIITLNYNLKPLKKIFFIPDKLYPYLSETLPFLYDWEIPISFDNILRDYNMKSGFAHGCGLIPTKSLREIGGYNEELIGYGPEDDLFNKRLSFNARIYYHNGSFRSSTFHIFHRNHHHQNKKKNWLYWKKITKDLEEFGIYSDARIRKIN